MRPRGFIMKKNVVIGITGGPATGKSLVARKFRDLGAALIDADVIAREVLTPGTSTFHAVVRAFGRGILLRSGAIDRKALGKVVFSDYARLAELTALTHPEILRVIRKRIARLKKQGADSVIAVDAPLLFESGLDADMEKIIVVFTDEEVEIKRLMARDNIDREAALRLMGSQMPLEEKKKRADYLIDNNGKQEETLGEAEEIYKKIFRFLLEKRKRSKENQ